jgi:predicted permease
MNLLFASIRNPARQFWASRVFTAVAVLTLALGIGGTTAIFTLIDAVMLRPLPVSDPARLYRIGDGDDTIAQGRHGRWGFFSFPLYERLKAATPEFEDVTAFGLGNQLSVRRQGTAEAARPLWAEYVAGTYFSTLGVGTSSGRVFAPDDDRSSAPPVAVLSHHTWQGVYGADPSVVGSTFVVEGRPFTVIGVAAPGFFGESVRAFPPDIWIPLQQEPVIAGGGSLLHQSTSSWLVVIGRLRRDASIAGMAPRLTEILRQWLQYEDAYPRNWMPDIIRDLPKQTVAVVPAGAGIGFGGLSLKEQYGPSLQMLLAICGLVLVIACANVANLMLARAVARRAQTAVRLAIGATGRQIVAEALTESVLVAVAGGLVGLLVAMGAARLLIALAFRNSPFVPITTTPSLVVLGFAVALSLLTGIVFGAAPAWFRTRIDPIDALRGSGRSTGYHSSRARTVLLIVQATLSVVVVAGSTMLARSLANLEHQDFGFRVQGRVMVGLNRLPSTYTLERLSSLYRDVEQRIVSLPGVRGAGLALYNPLTNSWTEPILVAGHPPNAIDESRASWDRVSADYLQNLGVTIVRGRLFTAADNETTAPVAVVNETFAKRFFKDNEDPIDQNFGVERPENAGTFRIVGIVRDAKFARSGLNQPARPMFFVPLAQRVGAIPSHPRDDGGHRLPSRRSRANSEEDAGGSRSEPDDHVRQNNAAADRLLIRSRAGCCLARRTLRNCRPRVGRSWCVRRHGLHGRAADERNRRPYGAGRGPRQGDPVGVAPGVSARGGRARYGPASGGRHSKVHVRTALWRVVLGPLRSHGRGRIARSVRAFSFNHAGSSSCRDLADERAAHRLVDETAQ